MVTGVTAGVGYRVHQSQPAPATSGSATTTSGDAAESAHGTSAGLATGAGPAVRTRTADVPVSDLPQMAHGSRGVIVYGR